MPLNALAAVALAAGLVSAPAPTVEDLGPASSVTSISGAEFVGDKLYLGTGGIKPTRIGAYDPAQRKVTSITDLPSGDGTWATAAVGSDLYVGTYSPGDIHKVDTTTGTATKVADVKPDNFIWSMDAAADGKIYAGTYPGGRVVEYDPATGQTRDLGQAAAGEQYVRSIAVDDTTVYAGVGAKAHLVAIDRATGAKKEILPPELADRTFVGTLALENGLLAAGLSATGDLLLMETADTSKHVLVDAPGDSYVTAIGIDAANNDVYFGTRPSGTLYRYDRDSAKLDKLAVPYDGAAFNRIFVRGGKLVGALTSSVVEYDLATGELTGVDLTQAGMPPAPELPMAIAVAGDRVLVSGKAGIQVHDPAAGTSTRTFLPGEAKAMTPVGDQVYLSVYTLAYLFKMRHDGTGLTRLTRAGAEQNRPLDAHYDRLTRRLLMGTQPEYGLHGGALALYDPRRNAVETFRGVVPNQSVRSVTSFAGTAYLGSEIQGGLGTTPVEKEARLAAFDLFTKKTRWSVVPVPGATRISDLVVRHGKLYGLASTGVAFEFDLLRRKVTRTVPVPLLSSGSGTLIEAGGRIYGSDGKRIYRLDPRAMTVTTVVDGLAGQAYGDQPLLAAAPGGRTLYALKARNLVRIKPGS
ncbi:PQQ-binding-like beta-propeller repeat protein [Nonomuraea sp. NPDC050790]|uniref:outer membrane protein assembly factor BamB family protein n=1 Tax=Nonomuraea sp. NPDC050790 TaxID=3364371 RepID=UPI0037A95D1F